MNILFYFSISYMCEQAYSTLTRIISKDKNHLISVKNEIYICLTEVGIIIVPMQQTQV